MPATIPQPPLSDKVGPPRRNDDGVAQRATARASSRDDPGATARAAPRATPLASGLTLLLVLASFAAALVLRTPRELPAGFAVDARWPEAGGEPIYLEQFASNPLTTFVHGAAAAEIGGGRIRAFWVGGTRESHSDVVIYTAVYDPAASAWSPETVCITRDWLKRHLARNIIALGNVAAGRHPDGRLLLWFVSVSLGGWSGSSINMVASHDDGETWGEPIRLITSPLINIATLVKQPPFMFADGTIGLPVYHESFGKFAELLRLDPSGQVLHKQRLSWGRSSLQPLIVPRNELEATGFLRRSGSAPRHTLALDTKDGGLTWSPIRALEMPNASAPIAAVRLPGDELLLAFNNTQRRRDKLVLALSSDEAQTYRIIHEVDRDDAQRRGVSYPYLIRTAAGDFHLFYTWYHERIRHVHFNRAWLEQRR